ncbi:hypothetical protein BJY04DRAFT_231518 [Aspergillus karnatakaensis]|uniref:Zn(II)2Cys6 transcription factor n=1 Tax=Aspergillus karnatakaensis TaxID=1810916 RepID=UPI003CCD6659
MVERSTGCLLCVKRRVKCDERLPGCSRCETYGKPCPGYNRGFKFVTAKPYRSRRKSRQSSLDQAQDGGGTISTKAIPCKTETSLITPSEMALGSPSHAGLNLTQCFDRLTDEMSQPFPSTSGYVISRWFLFLPQLYGRSGTLDVTMKAFVAHHVGNVTINKQAVRYARSAYLVALSRLRKSLSTPSESLSSEVYCSVLLLCIYELFADTQSGDVWMKHAKGLTQLTSARGVSSFRTPFDSVLLKASRGLIVMYSLFGGDECLLASEEWHAVMKQQHNGGLSTALNDLVEEFFTYFSHSPSLVHRLYSIKEADLTDPAILVKISILLKDALDLQTKLISWHDRFTQEAQLPYEVLSSTPDTIYPTVLWYSDVNSATIYCGYYSYMVLIHEILTACGHPGEHKGLAAYFCDQICKSVEFTAQGLLGPYRMGFPLRVAWEVADPVTKKWIEGCLKTFSEFYAVLREDNF